MRMKFCLRNNGSQLLGAKIYPLCNWGEDVVGAGFSPRIVSAG